MCLCCTIDILYNTISKTIKNINKTLSHVGTNHAEKQQMYLEPNVCWTKGSQGKKSNYVRVHYLHNISVGIMGEIKIKVTCVCVCTSSL